MNFRRIILLLLIFAALRVRGQEAVPPDLPADYPSIGFSMNPLYYSVGVKFGIVLNPHRDRIMFRTFEGDLMLGLGTSPGQVSDRRCEQAVIGPQQRRAGGNQQLQDELRKKATEECFLFRNPLPLSYLSSATHDIMVGLANKPAVVYYINYYITPRRLLMRTNNQVLNVFPITPDLQIEKSFQLRSFTRLRPEAGYINGRVVQASYEFPLRKTYEVIIQESENANNFRAMSVSNGRMFRYITRAMLTGKLMRIGYMRLLRPEGAVLSTFFNYLTNFRVISVELVDKPEAPVEIKD
jgi:hypothetical protein